MSKATVIAPSNIAFIKYWGARDLDRVGATNPSISMTLSRCVSQTTVQLRAEGEPDEIFLVDEDGRRTPAPPSFASRIQAHLDRLRQWAERQQGLAIATRNSFPASAGIASSASGFAALTLAVVRAFGETPSSAELSDLARRSGSGSATRSVMGGYVEWPAQTHATTLAPADHGDLRDVIALIETGPKDVSSLDGHRRAPTSPYFERRLTLLPDRLERVREAIRTRDFEALGETIEEEAIDLHLIAMSSKPPIFYWAPGTLTVLEAVRRLRAEGVPAASTMDAGANVHVICPPASEDAVADRLEAISAVHRVIRDRVGTGPADSQEHLL